MRARPPERAVDEGSMFEQLWMVIVFPRSLGTPVIDRSCPVPDYDITRRCTCPAAATYPETSSTDGTTYHYCGSTRHAESRARKSAKALRWNKLRGRTRQYCRFLRCIPTSTRQLVVSPSVDRVMPTECDRLMPAVGTRLVRLRQTTDGLGRQNRAAMDILAEEQSDTIAMPRRPADVPGAVSAPHSTGRMARRPDLRAQLCVRNEQGRPIGYRSHFSA